MTSDFPYILPHGKNAAKKPAPKPKKKRSTPKKKKRSY